MTKGLVMAALVAACGRAPEPAPATERTLPAPTAAASSTTTNDIPSNWWCTYSLKSTISSCQRRRELCAQYKAEMERGGSLFGDCFPKEVALCYDRTNKFDGHVLEDCAASMESCRTTREDNVLLTAEDWTVGPPCEARR